MTEADQPRPRVYGDDEVGRILKRATELQHVEPTARSSGVTLAELEEIAAEAGIDPRHLRRAALELEREPGDLSVFARLAGEELVLVREITLPGELDVPGLERLVGVIQAHSPEHGQAGLIGRTLTWRAESPSNTVTTQILAAARSGETTIRVEENMSQMASGLFGGFMVGGGVGLGMGVGLGVGLEVLGSALFAGVLPVACLALGYVGARGIYRVIAGRRRRALDRLFDLLVEEARVGIEEARKRLEEGAS